LISIYFFVVFDRLSATQAIFAGTENEAVDNKSFWIPWELCNALYWVLTFFCVSRTKGTVKGGFSIISSPALLSLLAVHVDILVVSAAFTLILLETS
jgi:hypothetical protein